MTADTPAALESRIIRARARLEGFGQGHLLTFWNQLSRPEQLALLQQCEALPLEALPRATEVSMASHRTSTDLAPAEIVPHTPLGSERYRAHGATMIAAGQVACFTVAGGQGTRLGWEGPKGTFAATPVTGKSLFHLFAESILATRRKFGGMVRWYIMTSPLNHDETMRYFDSHDWFELGESTVRLFMQGTLPSLAHDGKILLATPGSIALSPDGHGGAIRALAGSGALEEMRTHGIETLSYFQVDNPLARAVDPLFLGLHAIHPESSAEVSSKVVPKRNASEKVGVFCRRGARTEVVEYSDLPPELAEATRPDGGLLHWAGSIAIHAFSRRFLEGLADGAGQLPLHRALKRVPCVDLSTGAVIEPATPNAIKLEAFIFDAVPLASKPLVYETTRDEEFAPIKNADGDDSPATSRTAQSERGARWLEQCGVPVPRRARDGAAEARIEISPLTALCPEDLGAPASCLGTILPGSTIVL